MHHDIAEREPGGDAQPSSLPQMTYMPSGLKVAAMRERRLLWPLNLTAWLLVPW